MTKKKADLGGKRLIGLAPDQWVQWVTDQNHFQVQEIISSEFQWIGRDNDVLIKVTSPQVGDLLILNELQLRYDDQVPRRMYAYAALATERYQLPVYPVLINILPPNPGKEIPNTYQSNVMGLFARQDYRVINLSEVDVQVSLGPSFAPLLPFVPIMQNGSDERVVQEALQRLRLDSKLNELEPLLAFFASFVLSSEVVQRIMRWDMAVLLESPWYQEILKRGEAIGELKGEARGVALGEAIGEARGVALGEARGLLSAIELALELKFGNEGLQLFPTITPITDLNKLRAIRQALRTANNLQDIVQICQTENVTTTT